MTVTLTYQSSTAKKNSKACMVNRLEPTCQILPTGSGCSMHCAQAPKTLLGVTAREGRQGSVMSVMDGGQTESKGEHIYIF